MQVNNDSKIRHVWSILCGQSSIDQETNNLFLYNILEQLEITPKQGEEKLNLSGKKVAGISLEFITLWQKNKEGETFDGEQLTEWVDPKGEVLNSSINPFKIPKALHRARFRFKANGIPFTVPGEYKFRASVRERGQSEFIYGGEIPLSISFGSL